MTSYHNKVILAMVVQRVDNTLHWINHYPVDKTYCSVKTNCGIHRIEVYLVVDLVDSVIHQVLMYNVNL